jgi:hypothetical protein
MATVAATEASRRGPKRNVPVTLPAHNAKGFEIVERKSLRIEAPEPDPRVAEAVHAIARSLIRAGIPGDEAKRRASAQSTVIAQRLRAGVPLAAIKDQRAENFFGRLMLQGLITPSQYQAGMSYAHAYRAYNSLDGVGYPHPRAIDLEAGSRGQDNRPDPNPDDIARIRRTYKDAEREIKDAEYAGALKVLAGLSHSATYHDVKSLLWRVIVLGEAIGTEPNGAQMRKLKAGLNVVRRYYRFTE